MNYQEELSAKLDAIHEKVTPEVNRVDINTLEEKLLGELNGEFEFSQYDLEETDVLRTLKILDVLQAYGDVFNHSKALKVFYILCRVDVITAKNLHNFCALTAQEFKEIINAMAQHGLVFKNDTNELELTLDGKSLASRIGIDIFL